MDALAGLLDGPRARGAFLLRCVLDPPFSLLVEDRAPLTIVAALRGLAWVVTESGEPVQIRPGDVALMRGPDPYVIADDPATAPQVVIHPGQRCTTIDGEDLKQAMHLGVRTWGNSPDGANVMLVGTYLMDTEVSKRLLGSLPPLLVVPEGSQDSALVALLDGELAKEEAGQEVILDRLLDLLLISVVRTWFARPESAAPAWYVAQSDPIVGTAIRMLHNNPTHPWTVAKLASEIGISRAALARRFTNLVGEPPMAFLTDWRLTLAADLLRELGMTIAAVAEEVGYGSPYALSTAFKRVRGVSPNQHRKAAARSLAQAITA
jgi:AraC-like DNA-binding protein